MFIIADWCNLDSVCVKRGVGTLAGGIHGDRLARIFLWMCSANEGRRYIVTSFLIGWAHTQNDPCLDFRCCWFWYINWNEIFVILTKFSSLAALEVVKMTTSNAANDANFYQNGYIPVLVFVGCSDKFFDM